MSKRGFIVPVVLLVAMLLFALAGVGSLQISAAPDSQVVATFTPGFTPFQFVITPQVIVVTPTATPIVATPLPEIPPGALTGTVVDARVLLVRAGPFMGAPVIGRIRRGQTYQVLGRDENARWFLLQLSGFQGWAYGYYLFINGNEFNAPPVNPFVNLGDPEGATDIIAQAINGIKLRAAPTTESEQIGRIHVGDLLPILGRSGDGVWYQVVYKDTVGWIHSDYVRIVNGDINAVPIR